MSYSWLRLTLDISHWFCVAETLLEDQEDTVTALIPHIQHLHARIGHTQGPQLADPGDGLWEYTIERHFAIWELILRYHAATGKREFGITTEYGPWPYMHQKNDFSVQFALNVSMLEQLKRRFSSYL
ncbi:MAG TPA: hypothetical protein VM802_23145 [Chitinophaga sp.]|uniref:hypothetical protein n=1 Tax=Chitinophaga sp. TaxID=1869181 RepID=UPI002CAC20A7|nr:hypothetical protein [Chitinophaga sp.]HVI47787.1 hypothetical protein [Chitinophaga sp.]